MHRQSLAIRSTVALALVVAVPLGAARVATAGLIGPFVGQLEYAAAGEASLMIVPDGSGSPFAEAHFWGDATTDATIRIQIVDAAGDPIAGYPAEDLWLDFEAGGGTVAGCEVGPFPADADTDADGWTGWSQPLRGGGWSEGPLVLTFLGLPAEDLDGHVIPPFTLRANSPDINGDLLVNLTDIVQFTENLTGYHFRSDFNWDRQLNLSDIVRFVPAIGVACP